MSRPHQPGGGSRGLNLLVRIAHQDRL